MTQRRGASRYLSGISIFALLSTAGATGALADDPSMFDSMRWSYFLQGGFAIDPSANTLPYAQFYGPDLRVNPTSTQFPFLVGSGQGIDFRGGIAAHFNSPWSARLAYTGLRTWKKGDTGQFPNYAVVSVLPNGDTPGSTGIGSSWNEAKVKTRVAADVADFQAGYDVGLGDDISTTLVAGVRYGDIYQKTHVAILDSGRVLQFFNDRRSNFTGTGITVGIEAAAPLFGDGFGVSGSVLGGALFGVLSSRTTGANTDNPPDPVIPRFFHDKKTAATLNADLALTYGPSDWQGVSFALGYQLSYYAGVRDTRNGSSGNGLAVYGSTGANLIDQGPFFRANVGL